MGYALITGASGGIGRELATLFAADGHDLVITARSQERLNTVKTKLEQRFGVHVVTFAIDLSEANAPKKLHDFTTSQGIAVDHLSITRASLTGRIFSTPTGTGKTR